MSKLKPHPVWVVTFISNRWSYPDKIYTGLKYQTRVNAANFKEAVDVARGRFRRQIGPDGSRIMGSGDNEVFVESQKWVYRKYGWEPYQSHRPYLYQWKRYPVGSKSANYHLTQVQTH